MRIWDILPDKLCRSHLLGEHSELHAIWSILTQNKTGFANHPETLRWRGRLRALYLRHEQLVQEMKKRGYNHYSPLDVRFAIGKGIQNQYVNSYREQVDIIKNRRCGCKL
jgi:hypothetical protein